MPQGNERYFSHFFPLIFLIFRPQGLLPAKAITYEWNQKPLDFEWIFLSGMQLIGDDSWRSEGKRPERFAIRQRRIECSGRPEQALEAAK